MCGRAESSSLRSPEASIGSGRKPLRHQYIYWLVDCSAPMLTDGTIQALNNAMREWIPQIKYSSEHKPEVRVMIYVISFSTGAKWHSANSGCDAARFEWEDIIVDSNTQNRDIGAALNLVTENLQSLPMRKWGDLSPIIALISEADCFPTDNFDKALYEFRSNSWGKMALRLAFPLGSGAADHKSHRFMVNDQNIFTSGQSLSSMLENMTRMMESCWEMSIPVFPVGVTYSFGGVDPIPMPIDLPEPPKNILMPTVQGDPW